jgi:hypothetical protein
MLPVEEANPRLRLQSFREKPSSYNDCLKLKRFAMVHRMKFILGIFVLTAGLTAAAQTSSGPSAPAGVQPTSIAPNSGAVLPRLEQEAQAINLDVARLHIEKWKADSGSKQEAQANATSIQRNLTAALPTLMEQVRANPQSMQANFKLYRNVDALYDVLTMLSESAGAFGGKSEYQALASHVSNLEDLRRSYADSLDALAASQDSRLAAAQRTNSSSNSQPATNTSGLKKIVVDDTTPPVHKPKKKPSPTPKPPSQ